jgi:hypothetical protein
LHLGLHLKLRLLPQGRNAAEITKNELARHFHLRSDEAATALGVGLTVLKRICRQHNIKRWPYRKIQSLERLIEHVQVRQLMQRLRFTLTCFADLLC